MNARTRPSFGLALLLLVAPATLRAQSSQPSPADKAAAESLFDQGLTLLREGRTREACVRLEQSQEIERGIGTTLYLAECYAQLGRTASAWALFREAASAARFARQDARVQAAEERAARLVPLLPRLSIDTAPGAAQSALEVRIDGTRQPVGLWGVPVPVDPGEHRIEARAPGFTPWATTVSVAPAQVLSVSIPALAPVQPDPLPPAAAEAVPVAASLPSGRAPATPPALKRSLRTRLIAISLGGAGVIAAGIGGYYGMRAIRKNDDAEQQCPAPGPICNDPRGLALTRDAERAARIANGLVFGGAGLAAAGLAVFLLRPGDRRPQVSAQVDGRGGALLLRGAF